MLVTGAVVPHPPLLVPGVGAGASDELSDLRAAATLAVRRVLRADVDLLVVVGGAPGRGAEPFPEGAWGSLAGYGLAGLLPCGDGPPTLPLSLTVAEWLLDQAGGARPRRLVAVGEDTDARRCAEIGARLAAEAPRVGLVVAGDGSARRSVKGPGYLDERAEPFDAAVAAALAAGDSGALLKLDPVLSVDLLVAGRPAWQVLAGAAEAARADGRRVLGDVGYAEAPYGVTYLVATWTVTDLEAADAG